VSAPPLHRRRSGVADLGATPTAVGDAQQRIGVCVGLAWSPVGVHDVRVRTMLGIWG